MKPLTYSALALLPVLAPNLRAATGELVLENAHLKRVWSTTDGRLRTVAIVNKDAGKNAELGASDEFSLRVSDGTDVEGTDRTLTAADFRVTGSERTTAGGVESLVVHLANQELTADLKVTLGKDDFYLRKQLTLVALKPLTLERVEPETLALKGAEQPYTRNAITANAPGNWRPNLGQPLYGKADATFWGVEFPAAVNTVAGDRLSCAYLHGRPLTPGKPYAAYPAVMGVSDDSRYVQDSFFEYIDRIRARPFRLQVQYNSWFDFGPGVNRDNFSKSVAAIHDALVTRRGVKPLDAYVVDDGWQDVKTSWAAKVWPVNAKFDADFASTHAAMRAAGSHLGLWLSPGMVFGASPKVPALKKEGYETLGRWASLAGPKYMEALENRMAELAAGGVTFYKLDGLFGHLNQREFELHGKSYGLPEMPQLGAGAFRPDDKRLNDAKYDELKTYYLTAGTERLMKNFDRLGKINPRVYIVISNAAYLSPWWLQHADASWMINSDDAAAGSNRTQELVYRDSIYHRLAVAERTQFPLNAIFNHEPKKLDSKENPEVFRSYLYMALSRGTGLIELYLKPAKLADRDWNVLAEGLLWADITGANFRRSRMHGGDPAKKEVYGYTGWLKDSGYVSLHNPSDKPATYRFTLDRAFGLLPGSGPFALRSPLPGSLDALKDAYAYGDTLEVTLKPAEVRILNFNTTPADFSAIAKLRAATAAAK